MVTDWHGVADTFVLPMTVKSRTHSEFHSVSLILGRCDRKPSIAPKPSARPVPLYCIIIRAAATRTAVLISPEEPNFDQQLEMRSPLPVARFLSSFASCAPNLIFLCGQLTRKSRQKLPFGFEEKVLRQEF